MGNETEWPLLAAQLVSTYNGERYGEVHCPWKKSSIAILRCHQWQSSCGQSEGCRSKPPQDEVVRLLQEMNSEDVPPVERPGKNYYKLAKESKRYGMCACGSVAAYRSTRECMACYQRRRKVAP